MDEEMLRQAMGKYGKISKTRMVTKTTTGHRRPYAFVEFEDERDVKDAVRGADGMKIDGKRLVMDVERGRTVKSWKPRRLGGGIGPGSRAKSPQAISRPPPPANFHYGPVRNERPPVSDNRSSRDNFRDRSRSPYRRDEYRGGSSGRYR